MSHKSTIAGTPSYGNDCDELVIMSSVLVAHAAHPTSQYKLIGSADAAT